MPLVQPYAFVGRQVKGSQGHQLDENTLLVQKPNSVTIQNPILPAVEDLPAESLMRALSAHQWDPAPSRQQVLNKPS